MRHRLPALAAALLTSGLAVAQAPPAPPATPVAPARQPADPATPQAYRAKHVLGSKVNIQGDLSVGTVDDIVFNDQGAVEYLIVANEGKLVTVPWEAAKFNFDRRVAVVNIPQEQYRRIPTYTVTTYPNYLTPAYRTEIYRYYGLTPGQQRRIERDRRP